MDFNQLADDLSEKGFKFYMFKGDVLIKLHVLEVSLIHEDDESVGLELKLEADNTVEIYEDDIVKKVRRPGMILNDCECCYMVCSTEDDRRFYIGKLA